MTSCHVRATVSNFRFEEIISTVTEHFLVPDYRRSRYFFPNETHSQSRNIYFYCLTAIPFLGELLQYRYTIFREITSLTNSWEWLTDSRQDSDEDSLPLHSPFLAGGVLSVLDPSSWANLRRTSANVERRQTISSFCSSIFFSRSVTLSRRDSFSVSIISSAKNRTRKKKKGYYYSVIISAA